MKPQLYILLAFILAASALSLWFAAPVIASFESSVSAHGQGSKRPLPAGIWGGKHLQMDVRPETIRIEFDCAHITGSRILLDSRGRFTATGTYVEERGGPTRAGEEHGQEVRLKGRVEAKTMRLTVSRTTDNRSLGSFILTHGVESELVKCR